MSASVVVYDVRPTLSHVAIVIKERDHGSNNPLPRLRLPHQRLPLRHLQRRRDHTRNHAPAQRARLAISPQQRQRVYARDSHRCVDCATRHDLTLDPLAPLAHHVKNHHTDDELATRCRQCNSRRGASHVPIVS